MNTIFVHRDGRTEPVTSIDRGWLNPAAAGRGVYLWVDLAAPTIPEMLVLTDTFAFHRVAVEASRQPRQLPVIDAYDEYLFAAVAGADADIAFFVGAHFIVSVHWDESKAVAGLADSVRHGGKQFGEGPFAMFHRLVHATVEGFAPVLQKHAACVDGLETRLAGKATANLAGEVLRARRDVFDLRQRLSREHDAVGRLAARQRVDISSEMAVRFRDVQNQLARLVDQALAVEDRLGALLSVAAALSAKKSWM